MLGTTLSRREASSFDRSVGSTTVMKMKSHRAKGNGKVNFMDPTLDWLDRSPIYTERESQNSNHLSSHTVDLQHQCRLILHVSRLDPTHALLVHLNYLRMTPEIRRTWLR